MVKISSIINLLKAKSFILITSEQEELILLNDIQVHGKSNVLMRGVTYSGINNRSE